jgi:hypothetical protein
MQAAVLAVKVGQQAVVQQAAKGALAVEAAQARAREVV